MLTGAEAPHVIERIKEFKLEFHERPGWEKGTPKRVNNLTMYTKREEREGKTNMPGHVRAGMNWNTLKRMNSDKYSEDIIDGMKTIVCKLKPNPLGWTSIGYPTDATHLPDWFKELPFDEEGMEQAVLDKKIQNVLGVTGWDLNSANDSKTLDTFFEF